MRSIKTIGQISCRGHSHHVNGSSTEALCIEHSFQPSDYQHKAKFDANGIMGCEADKEDPSDIIGFQGVGKLPNRALMGDNCSPV